MARLASCTTVLTTSVLALAIAAGLAPAMAQSARACPHAESDQDKIAILLRDFDGSGRHFKVIPLRRLPADAVARREARTAYPLELLFENIVRLDVPATIVLEVDFAADPGVPVIAPNWADDSAGVLPKSPQRNLVVMAAADRGQRPLEDTELGLGLFTRHLVQALAGGADSLPIGNGDGQIDSAEAYVHAAHWTAMTARKVYGVMQDPAASIGPGEPQPLARIKRQ